MAAAFKESEAVSVGRPSFDAFAKRPAAKAGCREQSRSSGPDRTLLFGDLSRAGFALEWSDFQGVPIGKNTAKRPHRVEVCLNLKGEGTLSCGENRAAFDAGKVWFAFCGQTNIEVFRRPQTRHQFLTLSFSVGFLADNLPLESGHLHPLVQSAVKHRRKRSALGEAHRLNSALHFWVSRVRKPPVLAAQPLWYRAKALEFACELLFVAPQKELFCRRQQRLAEERTTQVRRLLSENLAEPPSLKALGRMVGCSPYYLSRIFSQEAGMTIPQYLRQIRMERAAELLRDGRWNVTEAAMEVGYNSVSHFSQAFCQTMGCCPAMYPPEKG